MLQRTSSLSEGLYSVAPAERNSPGSFLRIPELEATAFPFQFSTGQNTLDEKRPIKFNKWLYQSKLFGVDDQFARDSNYLNFYLFLFAMITQLGTAKFFCAFSAAGNVPKKLPGLFLSGIGQK